MKQIYSPRLAKVTHHPTSAFVIEHSFADVPSMSEKEKRITSPTRAEVRIDIRSTLTGCRCLDESSAAALDRSVRFEHSSCASSHVRSRSRSFGRQHSPGDRSIFHSRFVHVQTELDSAAFDELQATSRSAIDKLIRVTQERIRASHRSIHRARFPRI